MKCRILKTKTEFYYMAGLERPNIELGGFSDMNFRQAVAEQMFHMLTKFSIGMEETVRVGSNLRTYAAATERYDALIDTEDEARNVAFRIKGTPVLQTESPDMLQNATPSDKYVVLELQMGTYQQEQDTDAVSDDEFEWKPYVLAVVDRENVNEPDILNAENGNDLDYDDLLYVLSILGTMRVECQKADYETQIINDAEQVVGYVSIDDLPPFEEIGSRRYAAFAPDDLIGFVSCEACSVSRTACPHLLS